MHLYIVRHAWAHEHGDPRWPVDSERPLEMAGAERMARVVQVLAQRGFAPEMIATSPYVRCVQTAEVVAANLPTKPAIAEIGALKPGSNLDLLVEWSLAQNDNTSLCWVGHAPDVSWLVGSIIGDEGAAIRFPKGGVAAIRCEVEVGAGLGELEWLATAKLLGV